jgi:hypothetical protein
MVLSWIGRRESAPAAAEDERARQHDDRCQQEGHGRHDKGDCDGNES